MKRAKEPCVIRLDEIDTVFNPDRIVPDNHPAVKAHPSLFVDAKPWEVDRVEQATAGPGERRNR
jgi:hypothetical protein